LSFFIELASKPFVELWNRVVQSVTNTFFWLKYNVCIAFNSFLISLENFLNRVRPIIPYAFASTLSYDIIKSKIVRSKGLGGIIRSVIGGIIGGMLLGYLLDYFTPVDVRLPRLCCGEVVSELHEEFQATMSFTELVELVSYA
jgi:hypothetical protein